MQIVTTTDVNSIRLVSEVSAVIVIFLVNNKLTV